METKRPFARVAARTSAGCAIGALALCAAPYVGRLFPSIPEVYAQALFTLSSLLVCLFLLFSLALGATALFGLKQHGRQGILVPAMLGLVISGLMLLPLLRGLSAGMAAHARDRQGPALVSTNRN